MNLVHKSVCLLLTSVMMFQVSAGFNTTPIQGAMYAEIHDPQRGCQKVYRGSANVIAHNIVQQMVVKVAHEHPQIDFFDTNGRWLLSEGLPNPATLTKPLAEMLQARLTVLPEVTRIEVIESNKQRGNQIVYLYNRFGDVIGHWHRFWAIRNLGEFLPADVVEGLSKYVSNPEALRNLRVSKYVVESRMTRAMRVLLGQD